MKALSYFFFYSYIGLVTLAGFWGAFLNAHLDHRLLFQLDTQSLPEYTRTNMLSQYRFLRAIELGFGLFSFAFTKAIFRERTFNRLFLSIMSLGVLARLASVVYEGNPSRLTWLFLLFEGVGVIIIFLYTRKTAERP